LQIVKIKKLGYSRTTRFGSGTTEPDVLARIRAVPRTTDSARSIWAEGGNLNSILAAGLNANGDGLLIRFLKISWGKSSCHLIRSLREINQTRVQVVSEGSTCSVWLPDVCLLNQHYLDLILQLYDIGCIMFGNFVQASGATFPTSTYAQSSLNPKSSIKFSVLMQIF